MPPDPTNEPNPYAPPRTYDAPRAGDSYSSGNPSVVDFGEIIGRWERLRVVYNTVLIALVMLLVIGMFPGRFAVPRFWVEVCFGAIIANVCFMAGPTIEGYCRFLKLWANAMRPLLFLAGTCFAAILAVACVLSWI